MNKIVKRMKSEYGAAQMVENIIVLPVVFAIIIFIIYLGQMQYQKSVIASTAERAIIWIEQAESNYQYKKMTKLDLSNSASDTLAPNTSILNSKVDRQPYRYVAGLFSGKQDFSETESYIENYIESKEIFPMGEASVKITTEGSLYKKVKITIEQDLLAPEIIPGFDLPTVVKYTYEAESCVMQPSETIRNIDFACELAKPLIDKASNAIQEVKDKINSVFDKIKSINNLDQKE